MTSITYVQPGSTVVVAPGSSGRRIVKSTVTVESRPVPALPGVSTVARNGAIGGAVGAAVAGVSWLGKIGIPLLGKVSSLAGVARFAGLGAGIGIAATVVPALWPRTEGRPALRAALVGAGVGGGLGSLVGIGGAVVGAAVGAGVGLGIHAIRRFGDDDYGNGYWGNPCGIPVGCAPPMSFQQPSLWDRLTGRTPSYPVSWYPQGYPGFGGYPAFGMGASPYLGYGGYPMGMPSYPGYGMLGMQRAGAPSKSSSKPAVVPAPPAAVSAVPPMMFTMPLAGAPAQAQTGAAMLNPANSFMPSASGFGIPLPGAGLGVAPPRLTAV